MNQSELEEVADCLYMAMSFIKTPQLPDQCVRGKIFLKAIKRNMRREPYLMGDYLSKN